MPETKTLAFTLKELAELLVKNQDIHEGLWGVYIEFALGAGNVGLPPGDVIFPAAIAQVVKIGLQKFDTPSSLTVDASLVNPVTPIAPSAPRSRTTKQPSR